LVWNEYDAFVTLSVEEHFQTSNNTYRYLLVYILAEVNLTSRLLQTCRLQVHNNQKT